MQCREFSQPHRSKVMAQQHPDRPSPGQVAGVPRAVSVQRPQVDLLHADRADVLLACSQCCATVITPARGPGV